MWRIDEPTIERATLNFTSSSQGRPQVSQLKSGGVILMNALELMEWSPERTQVIVCDSCGIPSCESGGWVNLRRTTDRVLLIPPFDEIEQDNWSRDEYRPPRYLQDIGTPYFELPAYESLVARDIGFPVVNEIALLQMREAVRLAQREMPYQIFGEPPEVRLTREKASLVIAASEGEGPEHLSKIEEILKTNYESRDAVTLRKPNTDERIIYLFLDADEFTEWAALVKNDRGQLLLLDEELVVEANRDG